MRCCSSVVSWEWVVEAGWIAEPLAKAGYETHLVIPFEAETVKDGVHIHPCPRLRNRLLHMLITPWLAMRLALKTHADIYQYHDPELMFIGFIFSSS